MVYASWGLLTTLVLVRAKNYSLLFLTLYIIEQIHIQSRYEQTLKKEEKKMVHCFKRPCVSSELLKETFHNSTDTAFIQLSKLSRKEKPLLVPSGKSDLLGETPQEALSNLKSSAMNWSQLWARMMEKAILKKEVQMYNLWQLFDYFLAE